MPSKHELIFCLTGESGAGKTTFAKMLAESFTDIRPELTVARLTISDILKDILREKDIPTTPANISQTAMTLQEQEGRYCLARRVNQRIERSHADFFIVDGVRQEETWEMVSEGRLASFLYVYAGWATRLRRKIREGAIRNYGEFQQREQDPTEIPVRGLRSLADAEIDNQGSLQELKDQANQLVIDFTRTSFPNCYQSPTQI